MRGGAVSGREEGRSSGAQPAARSAATLFLVFRDPGPGWVAGRSTREQPGWEEHAIFMDGIFEQGRIVMAGPYADYSRVLLIIEASSRDEAARLLDGDPWNATGILGPPEVIEWRVFLDRGLIPSKGPTGPSPGTR